ncbi:MAG: hypothetical protein WC081_03275 [Candidatus Ratteibacteria bacterium]|jgi:hypothetical protein
MKQVTIGNLTFSKVLCGTNAFWGHSHFSEARNAEYLHRFDDKTIERTIQHCIDLGVNTIESCANERIFSIVSRLRENNPAPIRFVGSTRIDETSEMKSHQQKLSFLIKNRADICVIHAQYADIHRKDDSIGGLKELIDKIHEAGLLAGISTHGVRTIELCEKQNYGIDTYLFPLNLSGFVYPGFEGKDTVQNRVNIVCGVKKPFILIKTLAAGRIPPEEGLHFVAENSKPNDLISLGFGGTGEIAESIQFIEKYF